MAAFVLAASKSDLAAGCSHWTSIGSTNLTPPTCHAPHAFGPVGVAIRVWLRHRPSGGPCDLRRACCSGAAEEVGHGKPFDVWRWRSRSARRARTSRCRVRAFSDAARLRPAHSHRHAGLATASSATSIGATCHGRSPSVCDCAITHPGLIRIDLAMVWGPIVGLWSRPTKLKFAIAFH
jgi:hypothetical protein